MHPEAVCPGATRLPIRWKRFDRCVSCHQRAAINDGLRTKIRLLSTAAKIHELSEKDWERCGKEGINEGARPHTHTYTEKKLHIKEKKTI